MTTVADNSVADLQREKLSLEIKGIRRKQGLLGWLAQSVPFLTALVAVGGLWVGGLRFIADRQVDRGHLPGGREI